MQEDALWQAIVGEMELSVSRGSYITWFKNTRVLRTENDTMIIGVANIFAKQQMESKYKKTLKELLIKYGGDSVKLEFKIHSSISQKNKKVADEPVVVTIPRPSNSRQTQSSALAQPGKQGSITHSYRQDLNKRYTFDSFIVGSNNELAYAACQGVVNQPGNKYNPLFVYGDVGLGKTHIIQAVGNDIKSRNPGARVVYIASEQFVQEFLDAIRYKKVSDFAKHYRTADVLIIDDIQFIAGKERTQEEFFHTFNTLHQANKQIILSSDKPPNAIPTLEDRLRSRFEWGMIVDIGTPDFETRCAILQNKAAGHEVELPQDVVEFLANRSHGNVRELEGSLNQLLAFCEMRSIMPELDAAIGLFGNGKTRPKHLSAKQIVDKTAKQFQISLDEILSPRRDRDIVVPRQVAMYLLRSELHLSFPKIAHELGRKDHTTAIHSVEKIEKELHFDNVLKDHVKEIKEKLYA